MAEPASVALDTPAATISVEQQADGSVVVNLDTKRRKPRRVASGFDENLAESLEQDALSTIATEIIDGVEADERSRSAWLKNYSAGLQLLGLLLEEVSSAAEKTVSRVRHPLLLWSIIKFQALTQGELLPADGPVKVKNDGALSDTIAADLEKAWNRYLTKTCPEYYPDMDRALFYLGYGGTIFKKVYKDPIRRRVVSDFVALPDLIVSQDAVALQTASRVTHRIDMSRRDVRRFQKLGYWLDTELPEPTERIEKVDSDEARYVTGVAPNRERREDWDYEIFETYTNLDLSDYGFSEPGAFDGMELPYRVTLDRDSRQILEVRRNWKEGDPAFLTRRRFASYNLIPGIGFLALGYLHLLGNTTKALTALERIIIDSGMFANFPGGVRAKGARMDSNVIQPAPGEFPEIETMGLPIQSAIMALPFKGPDTTMLALLQGLEAQGEKTAGQVEIKTGEGIADVPVGTTMAMIEQSTTLMTAVHRRLHQAQGDEFGLMQEFLAEEPELLNTPGVEPTWTAEQLRSAVLRPASNPNVPAHIHRIMQAVVLETLSTAHPELYDAYSVQQRILSIARINDWDQFLHPAAPQGQSQDPATVLAMLQNQIAQAQLALRKQSDERTATLKAAEIQLEQERVKNETVKIQGDQGLGASKQAAERQAHIENLAEKAADRVSRETSAMKSATGATALSAQESEQRMDEMNLNAMLSPPAPEVKDGKA